MRYVRSVVTTLVSPKLEISLLLAMNVLSLCVVLAMSTRGKMELSAALTARLDTDDSGVSFLFLSVFSICCCMCLTTSFFWNVAGSPRVEGDEDEDDVDDIENEFSYAQGGANKPRRREEFSSSSRHDSQPIPLLTHGHAVRTYIFSLDYSYCSRIL